MKAKKAPPLTPPTSMTRLFICRRCNKLVVLKGNQKKCLYCSFEDLTPIYLTHENRQ